MSSQSTTSLLQSTLRAIYRPDKHITVNENLLEPL